ncbi:MAG: SLBB domain-containing protein, partial [Flavobacteriaceae bacterium]
PSYKLGPGDEITIDVWGASETRYEGTLSRQGVIKIDRLPPLYLSGLTLAAAQKQIRKTFLKIYTGLASDASDTDKVFLDVNLKKARSIIVNITGNVQAPGTYTLSGFTSVLNALYAAGGPDKNGSFRKVKVVRGGKTATTVDLYDYFLEGNYPDFFLNDQDVIVVASYDNRVRVKGAFKTQGVFETRTNETVQEILRYTGGFTSNAYKGAMYMERINGLDRSVLKVESKDYDTMIVQDGDVIEAKAVSDKYTNRVIVSGEVYLPGSYPLEEAPNLSTLLLLSSGLSPDAYTNSALLYRTNNGVLNEMISVDLQAVLSNEIEIDLQPDDRLVVFNANKVEPERKVSVQGAVNSPNSFVYYDGMTARDLLLLASGFKLRANKTSIEVYRNRSHLNDNQQLSSLEFSEAEADQISIEPGDFMVVRLLEGFRATENVRLTGFSRSPGTYPIKSNKYTLYDLYIDSQGALEGSSLSGVSVSRLITNEDQDKLESVSDSLIGEIDAEKRLSIGVNLEEIIKKKGNHKDNIVLKANDVINIPSVESTISLIGEVQRETVVPFSRLTTKQAIIRAGGFSQKAKRNRVYVVYQNGSIRSTTNFLFLRFRPKLEPGAIVVVPQKVQRQKMSLQEGIGITTAVASLTVLIRTLINN